MPGSTPIYALPYPVSGDPIYQGAQQMQALAEDIEDLMNSNGVVVNGKVSRAGDTMTGDLIIARDGVDAQLKIDSDPGRTANLRFQTNGADRWFLGKANYAESGTQTGGDFDIARYTNAGAFIEVALRINREVGRVEITQWLVVGGRIEAQTNVVHSVLAASTDQTLSGNQRLAVLTGTTARTFTLPAVSGSAGLELVFKNRATAAVNLTIQRAGLNQIWGPAGAVNSIAVAQHGTATLINDGTYWLQV